jgi:hypothetical protein
MVAAKIMAFQIVTRPMYMVISALHGLGTVTSSLEEVDIVVKFAEIQMKMEPQVGQSVRAIVTSSLSFFPLRCEYAEVFDCIASVRSALLNGISDSLAQVARPTLLCFIVFAVRTRL